MIDKLEAIEKKYEQLILALSDPKVIGDPAELQRTARAHGELTPLMERFREYRKVLAEIAGTESLLSHADRELAEMAEKELPVLKERSARWEAELREMLLPAGPNDARNTIVEIRAGTGGGEAALFAANLFRMYTRFAEGQGWKAEILDSSPTDLGGFKEVVFSIQGARVFRSMKFESGVHRVQRVPVTEASGRIHTSAVTVAVLPEADEVEVQILPGDLRIDTFCSGGHGGQSVNTTKSAVRITHLPTNIVVSCQDERSQLKNKNKAMRVLRARLKEKADDDQHQRIASVRLGMVGSGDRSEKIRTYNFPQNRVTDHRIGASWQKLDTILDGDLKPVVDALLSADQLEKLKAAS